MRRQCVAASRVAAAMFPYLVARQSRTHSFQALPGPPGPSPRSRYLGPPGSRASRASRAATATPRRAQRNKESKSENQLTNKRQSRHNGARCGGHKPRLCAVLRGCAARCAAARRVRPFHEVSLGAAARRAARPRPAPPTRENFEMRIRGKFTPLSPSRRCARRDPRWRRRGGMAGEVRIALAFCDGGSTS